MIRASVVGFHQVRNPDERQLTGLGDFMFRMVSIRLSPEAAWQVAGALEVVITRLMSNPLGKKVTTFGGFLVIQQEANELKQYIETYATSQPR